MAKTSSEIIKQFGEDLETDIKKAIPKATGETADSVNTKFIKTGGNVTGFVINGGAQIGAIIDGRKPTSSGASKGSPTLQQQMLKWIRAKRIRPNDPQMSDVSLSWAMAQSIHKKGYRGKGNIFASVFTKQRFESLTKTLIKSETLSLQSSLIKELQF